MSPQLLSAEPPVRFWLDGLGGQEDELEDVQKGKLDPQTDDEGAGSILEKNDRGRALKSEDEDAGAGTTPTDERPSGEKEGNL